MTVSTVAEFLETVSGEHGGPPAGFLYRGQANADWPVDCSAVRRLNSNPDMNPTITGSALVAYTSELLDGAKRFVGKCLELPRACSELEILAQLQHQGAATGLIDFTRNSLVALWFACDEPMAADGAVYVLSRSDVRSISAREASKRGATSFFFGNGVTSDPPLLWEPRALNGRPNCQEAVFILGVPIVWPMLLRKIVVAREAKTTLLKELRTRFGMSEDTLFPDLARYAQANAIVRPFETDRIIRFWIAEYHHRVTDSLKADARISCGLVRVEMEQYKQAVQCFTEAISLAPKNISAHANRALAKLKLKDNHGAIADFSIAIAGLEKTGNVENRTLGRIYWGRGSAYHALGHDRQGCEDQNKALQLGFEVWINRETGEVTIEPGKDSQYRD